MTRRRSVEGLGPRYERIGLTYDSPDGWSTWRFGNVWVCTECHELQPMTGIVWRKWCFGPYCTRCANTKRREETTDNDAQTPM